MARRGATPPAVAAIGVAVLTVSGCYLVTPPPPEPPEPDRVRGELLSEADPCSLLTPSEADELDLGTDSDTTHKTSSFTSRCEWVYASGSLEIKISHYMPLGEESGSSPSPHPFRVHGRAAKLSTHGDFSPECSISLAVGPHESVTVRADALHDPPRPCAKPREIAELIEPRLPGG